MAAKLKSPAPPSRGRFLNTGDGPALQPIDIGHKDYLAVIAPDTAFWMLVKKEKAGELFCGGKAMDAFRKQEKKFAAEMQALRFGLTPSAVYFNPTERCNLNCTYCYIPEKLRRSGKHMTEKQLCDALAKLKKYFATVMPKGRKPQIIFHGAEPLLNRDAVFAGIEKYQNDFRFGVQTNATLLDEEAVSFLKKTGCGIGISLDGPMANIANRTRVTWEGEGVFDKVEKALELLKGYPGYNVIATVTSQNIGSLNQLVDYFHAREVPVCMLNIVRCTLEGARTVKPDDAVAAKAFMKALDHTHELYRKTGRKLVIANFANVMVGIVAPTARRLMCDISPCGGGRCFFALAPNGDLFPCSEFIGLPDYKGGNLFKDSIPDVLKTKAFKAVTGRKVEDITPCNRCAIRHFCGSPCPAEAAEMNGGMEQRGAFCEFYEEQVRYALRLIADGKENDYLWSGWDKDAKTIFNLTSL